MRHALTGLLILHTLWAGVPLARALLPGLAAADAWVLGPGTALTLFTWMLGWVAFLPGRPMDGWGPLACWAVIAGAGHLAALRAGSGGLPPCSLERKASVVAAWAMLGVFLCGVAVITLGLPVTHWDFLGRYGWQALSLRESGGFTAQIHGYPQAVQLFYAAVYAGVGCVDEGFAKVQALIFGALVLALTHRLAAHPRRPWVARGAVLLVGLSPVFLNSPPCGDPDLALTFHSLACLNLLLSRTGDAPARVAVACGLQLGLALWAKQAAAPLVVTLLGLAALARCGWLTHGWLSARSLGLALLVGSCLAGPWYLRNVYLTGHLTELVNVRDLAFADRSVASLALIRWYDELGTLSTPFLMLGFVALVTAALAPTAEGPRVAARRLAGPALGALGVVALTLYLRPLAIPPFDRYALVGGALLVIGLLAAPEPLGLEPRATITLAYVLPLMGVWALRFAFTARYILPLVPVLAAAGAGVAVRACGPLLRRSPGAWAVLVPVAALITSESYPLWRLTLVSAFEHRADSREAWFARGYPGALMGAVEELQHAPGALRARVASNDTRLAYFLDPPRPPAAVPASRAQLAELDYVVMGPYGGSMFASGSDVAALSGSVRALVGEPPVWSGRGYEIYRVKR